MKTEDTAYNVIADKLDALAGLPAGYTPNLESKWQLLETTLVEQRKSKRKILFILRAAAALVLIAALSLLFVTFKSTTATAPTLSANAAKAIHQAPANKEPEPVFESTRIHFDHVQPALVENKSLPTISKEEDLVNQEQEPVLAVVQTTSISDSIPHPAPLAKQSKKSKTRYLQMDFGEPTDIAQTNTKVPVYTPSLQFKLRPTEQPSEPEARESTQSKSFRIKF